MRLQNKSAYPDAEVRALVEFAWRGIPHNLVTVIVKNTKNAYGGYAYYGVPSMSPVSRTKAQNLVTIRIGSPDKFPRDVHYEPYKRAPEYHVRCWHEMLVAIVAHEAHHIRVYRLNENRRRRGAKLMPQSEVAAERWAVKRLSVFAATHPVSYACDILGIS